MSESGVPWLETSPADFDRRRAVCGYEPASSDQPGLFYVAAPTRESAPVAREELPGQGELFGDEPS